MPCATERGCTQLRSMVTLPAERSSPDWMRLPEITEPAAGRVAPVYSGNVLQFKPILASPVLAGVSCQPGITPALGAGFGAALACLLAGGGVLDEDWADEFGAAVSAGAGSLVSGPGIPWPCTVQAAEIKHTAMINPLRTHDKPGLLDIFA